MSHKLRALRFLRLFLPVALVVLTGIFLYGRSEYERELSRLKSQEMLNVSLGSGELSRNLEATARDLRFLVDDSALRLALDEPTPQHLDQLALNLANFSRSQGIYDQVRWIDQTGREVVRIDLVQAQAVIVPADQLQDKGQRYYFSDTFKLKPGDIFVSPLDLNVEQDKIELPYRPTLRVATPVADSRGTKRGIVILNYRGMAMLDAFAKVTAGIADHVMAANGEGYFLKAPKPDDEWGFMFNRTDLSLATQAPQAWAEIRAAASGQVELPDGLWSWTTVYPLLAGEKSSTGAGAPFAPSRGEVVSTQYVWKSIAHLPGDVLSALRQAVSLKLAMMAAMLLALLATGSWKLAQTWAALAASEHNLRESRDQLDGIYRSVGNGIVSVGEGQRIVLFNSAAERIFGYSAADMIGQPLDVLLPQRFRAKHEAHVRAFGVSGQSARTMGAYGLIYAQRANGEEFPIEATVSQSGTSPNKLFTVILNDITERRLSEQEREKLLRQLELLSERLATAQEEERRRIAYELHEELAQELAALKIYLQMQPTVGGATPASSRDEALAVVALASERVRTLVLDLNPRELDDFGLFSALQTYCKRQAVAGKWELHVDAPRLDSRAPRPVERACFRVLQEALSNVRRHAQASEVRISLYRRAGELELGVRDNGIGFDRNSVRDDDGHGAGSLGLFGMQIRAKQVGGRVEIRSAVGGGTEVRAFFPLPDEAPEADAQDALP